MKRILYTILTVFLILFTACGESHRERAQGLVDAFDATYLEGNRSVKSVGKVRLDSARLDFIYLPQVKERMERARRLAAENKECLEALQQPVASEVAYQILTKQLWETGNAVQKLQEQLLQEERTYNPRIPGWMTMHRFRVIGKDGKMKFYQYVLYFDPAVTRISGMIDLNDSVPVFQPVK